MPKGKGTYGSKVGRPPKKYQEGGSIDPFSLKNPESVIVENEMDDIEEANIQQNIQDFVPSVNAMDRSEVLPDVTEYNEGGKVEKKPIYGEMIKKAEESGRTGSKAKHAALSISRAHHGADFGGKKADITSVVKALDRTNPKKGKK